jgi:DNA-binding FrmR family transcriptional regulator
MTNETRATTSTGAGTEHEHVAPGYMQRKDDYLKRLKRIEGQVKGIERMVSDEQYCIDILTQVSAVTKALQAVALGLMDEHMAHCVMDAAKAGGPDAEVKLREASEAIARLVRS